MSKIKIYLKVTKDKYQLPVDFDTNYEQLAKRNGITPGSLLSRITHCKNNKYEHPEYFRVLIDDEENDEEGKEQRT